MCEFKLHKEKKQRGKEMSMWFGDYIDENVKNTNSSPIEWIKINIYNSKAKKNSISPLLQKQISAPKG